MDNDDEDTVTFVKNYFIDHDINGFGKVCNEKTDICNGCKQRFLNRHRDLLLPMTQSAKGDYFWILNDDLLIETKDFDKILLEQIENHLTKSSDRILYGKVKETFANASRADYQKSPSRMSCSPITPACYPIISRELYDALGWFLPPLIGRNGADTALHDILTDCKYDRLVTFPDIVLHDRVLPDIEERPDANHPSSVEILPRKLVKLLSGDIEEYIETEQL